MFYALSFYFIVCFVKKGKVVSVYTMKEYRGSRGTAPLILSLGTWWRCVVNFVPWLLYPLGKEIVVPFWVGVWIGLQSQSAFWRRRKTMCYWNICQMERYSKWKYRFLWWKHWVNTWYVDSFNVILLVNKCTRMKTKYIQAVNVIKFWNHAVGISVLPPVALTLHLWRIASQEQTAKCELYHKSKFCSTVQRQFVFGRELSGKCSSTNCRSSMRLVELAKRKGLINNQSLKLKWMKFKHFCLLSR